MPSTSQYILEIIGKDKTGQAFKQVETNVDKAKQSVVNLKNAIIAIGTGAVVRSIINTTARFQDLRTALSSVTGSAEAGAEAFGLTSIICWKHHRLSNFVFKRKWRPRHESTVCLCGQGG